MMTDQGIISSQTAVDATELVADLLPPQHSGEMLRRAREAQGKSLIQISRATHVRPEFLQAIENLDVQALPARGYVMGYVRAYAAELGMDPKDVIEQFKICYAGNGGSMKCKDPLQRPKSQVRLPRGIIGATFMIGAFAAVAFWFMNQPDTVAQPSASAVSPNLAAASAIEPRHNVTYGLKATGTTWVQIKDAHGEIVMSKVLIPGETVPLDEKGSWIVSVRNAGAVELIDGSEAVTVLGPVNQPVTDIALRSLQP